MTEERVERRLAAILAADVAGYSRLMGRDEVGTLTRLKTYRRELIDPKIVEHKGRIVKTTGDGLLIEFPSVVEALSCAAAVQQAMVERNAEIAAEDRIEFRVGINVGDIIVEGEDIFGDGVNIAARLEGLAEPGGICVSRRVQEDAAGRLDLEFEDLGEQTLKNIARPVRVFRVTLAARPQGGPSSAPAPSLPEKPSIAVLPFQNMSGDPEQEYFADGMVEEIITALSRIRWLFVVARNSTFTYKGQATDVKRIGRELGVRYVLEGSVRKAANRVRITAQLIEAGTGTHLWADRFDGSLEDVFDLQDKVATSVAGVIEPALQAAETARSANRPTSDLTAYDAYLRGYAMLFGTAKQIPQALAVLEEATTCDPTYGPALALVAICCLRLVNDGTSRDAEIDRRKGIDFARRALEVAGDDPGTLANAAFALACFGQDITTMTALVDRALGFNPSFARGWFISSCLRLWAGQPVLAIEHAEKARRLSPRSQTASPSYVIGAAHFISHQFEEAIPHLLLAIQEAPTFPTPYRYLAACYAHLERHDEAQETMARLGMISPTQIPAFPHPLRRSEHRELLLSGLRMAMGDSA